MPDVRAKPVFESKRVRASGACQLPDQQAMRANGTKDEATPVKVKQDRAIRLRGIDPGACDFAPVPVATHEPRGEAVEIHGAQRLADVPPAHNADRRHHRPGATRRGYPSLEPSAPTDPAPTAEQAPHDGGYCARDGSGRNADAVVESGVWRRRAAKVHRGLLNRHNRQINSSRS